jgi:uncharacterized protein YtpQ (UPF0354 family)
MLKQLRSLFERKPAGAKDPKELFAAEVTHFLKSLESVRDVTRGPDAFALDVVTSAGSCRWHLDNLFAETRELSPEERRQRMAFFFASVGDEEQDESWEDARETLIPVLRGATYGMESWMDRPEAAFVRQPFLPFVDVIVAMDRPTTMRFVSKGTVEGWKIDEREVFEAAAARTPVLANPSVELYDETHGPLWIVTSNDTYESSRLLVPGWLASFRGRVAGHPIAIIPERATLMVGGDDRPEMVERLLDKADREFSASSRRLSPALYTVDVAGRVIPYARSEGDGLLTKVQIAHEKLAIHEHQQQQKTLDATYEKNGVDVFVASYKVFDRGGSVQSLCVWTQGVRSYLPRTERVVLVISDDREGAEAKATVEVAFDAIRGRLTPVPDLHPPRYETTGPFPSAHELRLLEGQP